jgi:hypothetical protein
MLAARLKQAAESVGISSLSGRASLQAGVSALFFRLRVGFSRRHNRLSGDFFSSL